MSSRLSGRIRWRGIHAWVPDGLEKSGRKLGWARTDFFLGYIDVQKNNFTQEN